MTAQATYTKLRDGSWGVRLAAETPKSQWSDWAGNGITVAKKDGSTKHETIDHILWSGNGITLISIAQRSYGGRGQSFGGSRYSSRPSCRHCRDRHDGGTICMYCGQED